MRSRTNSTTAAADSQAMSGASSPLNLPIGSVARDTVRDRVGRVMGREGPNYQLRPLNGGREWEVAPGEIELAQPFGSVRGGCN